MTRLATVYAILFTSAAAFGGSPRTILSLSELRRACRDLSSVGRTFDVEGNVFAYTHRPVKHEWSFTVSDGEQHLVFYERNEPGSPATNLTRVALNDRIRLQGVIYEYRGRAHVGYKNVTFLRSCPLAADRLSHPQDLFRAETLHQLLRLRGCVRDAFRDEGDSNYIYMTIICDGEPLHVMVAHLAEFPFDPDDYLGAEVVVAGFCQDTTDCLRQQIRRILIVSGPENIEIVRPPEADLSKTPDLCRIPPMPPANISTLGRHQVVGTVLAAWAGNNILMRTDDGRIVKARIRNGGLPPCGRSIRVVGFPETDLYFINLVHADWSALSDEKRTPPPPVDTTSRELLTNTAGDPQFHVKAHGQAIRLTGFIRHLPQSPASDARLQIESGDNLVAVDVSAVPETLARLSVGYQVAVSGICVMDIGSCGSGAAVPQVQGFFLVSRTPDDIVVLSRPSWWTPGRLMALLGIFAAALFGVIGWNVSLNRRAKAKGRELAAEQLAHVTSELKVSERTRLAVELHDALSQTLTGVSMQIDTAAGFAAGKFPTITKCLDLASRTIDACRMELRNTLWDLRSSALDEPSMDAAIRKTLRQNLAGVDLSVRFNVAREVFSDNTAHAVLKIVRELATNALRHGRATTLRIAGTVDGGMLFFSVKDNGCGFDPDLVPGIGEGHFGLQGISERLERLNGEIKIESSPGKGTKATVTLPIPRSGE